MTLKKFADYKNLEGVWWLVLQTVVLPFRVTSTERKNRVTGTSGNSTRHIKSPASAQYMLEVNEQESCLSVQGLNMSPDSHVPLTQRTSAASWAAIELLPAGNEGEPSPLLSAGETYLEFCVQCLVPKCKRNMDVLGQVQWRDRKMMKGLEKLSYKGRLSELGLLSLQKRRLRGNLSVCINSWWEGMKRKESDYSQ